jgi:hypothetical protein
LDYLIVALSFLLNPFTKQPLDLAGAFVSPLLALLGGWFLWWWSRRMKFRYRWAMLILYAISPMLVHGTELGRPDHQSLLIVLVAIAICGEWTLEKLRADGSGSEHALASDDKRGVLAWAVATAAAWAVSIWVSAYEPLVLFLLLMGTTVVLNRRAVLARDRRAGWILFLVIIAVAFAIEQRVPSFAILQPNGYFKGWTSTIGELAHVAPLNRVWLNWCGFLLLIAPVLIWMAIRRQGNGSRRIRGLPIYVLFVATYCLTVWQARWGYFFVLVFVIALPALLEPIKSGVAVWIAFVLSLFPILQDWDERLWPNEAQLATRMEKRIESAQLRDLALTLRSPSSGPFLAPWWLSPSIVYWSGQPGVAGSSHESLKGIEDTAQFFLSQDLEKAREILEKHHVAWVFAYDSDRVAQNSASILDEALPGQPLCRVLERTPSQAPPFLSFFAQNPTCKLYRVTLER